jgi:DNA-directed RNA polymerase specialized sigma24 family protein
VTSTESTDFLDPARNIRAAVARAEQALGAFEEGATFPEVLEQLEKAHYRLERAQRAIVDLATEQGLAWDELAGPLGMNAREARRRFTESAWLGR